MLALLLIVKVFSSSETKETIINDIQKNINQIKNSLSAFPQVDLQKKSKETDNVPSLILEKQICTGGQKEHFWSHRSVAASRSKAISILTGKCLTFFGTQCNLTFKTNKITTAKAITFKNSPSVCAIRSFNLTVLHKGKEVASGSSIKPMDESELTYSYELDESAHFDKIEIQAENLESNHLCLCGIAIRN